MDCMVNSNIKNKEKKLIIINYALIFFEYLLFIILDCCFRGKNQLNATLATIYLYTPGFIVWDIVTFIQFAKHIDLLQIRIKIYVLVMITTVILQVGSVFFGIEMFNLFCNL